MKQFIPTLILIILCTLLLHAQNDFLQNGSYSLNTLPTFEQNIFESIKSDSMYSEFYPIMISNLTDVQVSGNLTLDLPNDNCGLLTFNAVSVEYQSENNYYWYGILTDDFQDSCFCKLGSLTLFANDSSFIGHIVVDNLIYEILSLSPDKQILAKVDNTKFTDSACLVGGNYLSLDSTTRLSLRNDGHCPVRCLVLYTPNALTTEGSTANIEARAQLAVRQTNQGLRNSDINESQLNIELVAIVPVNFNESPDIDNDINRFSNNPQVHGLRNTFAADIVVLLTDGDYNNVLGIVDSIGPNNNSAYAIVETGAATTGKFIFAHEVGHLFGGRHYFDSTPGIARGYVFKTGNFLPCLFGTKQRTIIVNSRINDVNILYYSNPWVNFDGHKTGVQGYRDNAHQLVNTACTVANFIHGPYDNLSVHFTTEYDISENYYVYYTCPCDFMDVKATIQGGAPGPYDIVWSYSIDNGVTFTPLNNNSSETSIPLWEVCPVQDGNWCLETCSGKNFILKITVEATDNTTASYYRTFIFKDTWSIEGSTVTCQNPFEGLADDPDKLLLSAFPNPSNGNPEIILNINTKGEYSVYIIDLNGNLVNKIIENKFLETGTHRFSLNLANDGVFFIRCIDKNGNQIIQKLIQQ